MNDETDFDGLFADMDHGAKIPERRCVVTGEVQPKTGLIRFVVGPGGLLAPDLAERLPGRGFYVTCNREVLQKAVDRKLFHKAARCQVEVAPDFVALIEQGLADRVVHHVSLARKAGVAVCGFEKVKGMLADERAKVLFQASDGSERGKSKLWTPEGGRFFGMLTSQELGLAFGRESVIHAALSAGGMTKRVVDEASRLSGLRGIGGGTAATGKVRRPDER